MILNPAGSLMIKDDYAVVIVVSGHKIRVIVEEAPVKVLDKEIKLVLSPPKLDGLLPL